MSSLSVCLRAFVPQTTSFGWAWGVWSGANPIAYEQLASVNEAPRVLRSYCATVSTLIRPATAGDRFNVTMFGANSGLVYGRDQWLWDDQAGRYIAHGEPWVPRTERAPSDVLNRAPEHATISPRTRRLTRPFPTVRHAA